MNFHGKYYNGWWLDNLQNKDDDALLGGKKVKNPISVDKKSTFQSIDGKNLVGLKGKVQIRTLKIKSIIDKKNINLLI